MFTNHKRLESTRPVIVVVPSGVEPIVASLWILYSYSDTKNTGYVKGYVLTRSGSI